VNLQIEDVRGLIINLETGNICGLWNLSQPFQSMFVRVHYIYHGSFLLDNIISFVSNDRVYLRMYTATQTTNHHNHHHHSH
jgi:hypothetical protein